MDNCMDAWMVNDERAAWMDERMDGWSDKYGDDDYDSEPLDEYGYDYNAYDDGHHDDNDNHEEPIMVITRTTVMTRTMMVTMMTMTVMMIVGGMIALTTTATTTGRKCFIVQPRYTRICIDAPSIKAHERGT